MLDLSTELAQSMGFSTMESGEFGSSQKYLEGPRIRLDYGQVDKHDKRPTKTAGLVAVQPLNEKIFQLCCQEWDVDIIYFDLANRLPFYLKAPNVTTAIARGIHFEIQ